MNPMHRIISAAILIVLFVFPSGQGRSAESPDTEEAKMSPPETWQEPNTDMKFVRIAKGCFQMGQIPSEKRLLKKEMGEDNYNKYYSDELPRHEVCVDGFWMGTHEVTQREWEKIMGFNPAHFNSADNFPVDSVSWDDAQSFIRKLNELNNDGNYFRLPTEAEWEYGARANTTTMYNTGDAITGEQANFNGTLTFGLNLHEEYRKSSTPTGSFPPNGFGLYDMHGNVWEWCNDWYDKDYYEVSPKDNPTGAAEGEMRVLRGGSWYRPASHIRSATRYTRKSSGQYADTGFRLVMTSRKLTKSKDVIDFNPDF